MVKNRLLIIVMMFMITGFAQEQTKKVKKEVKTVTYKCNMHCHSCQEKIEHNIAFEKGVKAITTDIDDNTVTVTYRTDKNTEEDIQKAIVKLGYTAEVEEPKNKKETKTKKTELIKKE